MCSQGANTGEALVVTGGDGDVDDDRRGEASPGMWSRYLCASSNVVERQLESPRASKCFGC
jgi:hypothetical protein